VKVVSKICGFYINLLTLSYLAATIIEGLPDDPPLQLFHNSEHLLPVLDVFQ
jgi:hypothetical protein